MNDTANDTIFLKNCQASEETTRKRNERIKQSKDQRAQKWKKYNIVERASHQNILKQSKEMYPKKGQCTPYIASIKTLSKLCHILRSKAS